MSKGEIGRMPGSVVPVPPPRTWRPMAAWTAAILLALGLAWFVGAVVVPVWQAKRVVRDNNPYDKLADMDPYYAIDELGGPERAARKLGIYVRMPPWIAGPDGLGRAGTGDKSHAILLLGLCGKSGLPPLIHELHSPDPVCRALAARSLGFIGPDATKAVPDLIGILSDHAEVEWSKGSVGASCHPVSWEAMSALGRIGPSAGSAVSHLISFLGDTRQETRVRAAEALSHMGEAAKDAAPVMREMLDDPKPYMRAYAAMTLGGAGTSSPDVIRILIDALGTSYGTAFHRQAALSLGAVGPGAKEAIPALERLLNEPYPDVRSAAAEALKKIRGEEKPK